MKPTPIELEMPMGKDINGAEPLYAQIPLEEYESIMRENKLLNEVNARLNEVLKRHGITLLKDG